MHLEENDWIRMSMQVLIKGMIGAIIALFVSILVLALASAAISVGWLDEGLMGQITVVACIIGAFVGGTSAGKGRGGKNLFEGILTGVLQFVCMLLIGTVFFQVTTLGRDALILAGACMCGGALSGLLTGKSKGKNRKAGEGKRRHKKR